jgi:hypothetical protein
MSLQQKNSCANMGNQTAGEKVVAKKVERKSSLPILNGASYSTAAAGRHLPVSKTMSGLAPNNTPAGTMQEKPKLVSTHTHAFYFHNKFRQFCLFYLKLFI